MSVRIVIISDDDTVTVIHDDDGLNHEGVLNLADLAHPVDARTGDVNDDLIVIPCPVPGCGAVSTHPFAGGSDPDAVQRLAVVHRMKVRRETFAVARNAVRERVQRQDRDRSGAMAKITAANVRETPVTEERRRRREEREARQAERTPTP